MIPDAWLPWVLVVGVVCVALAVLLGRRELRRQRKAVESGRMSQEEYDARRRRDRERQGTIIRRSMRVGIPVAVILALVGVAMMVTGEPSAGLACVAMAAGYGLLWTLLIKSARRRGQI